MESKLKNFVHKNVYGKNILEKFCIDYALDGTWVSLWDVPRLPRETLEFLSMENDCPV
jgi:hypothetical protein